MVRDNSLSIALFSLFFVFLVGQSLTGWRVYIADQTEHSEVPIGYVDYLSTGHFVEATFENWESEFLQMGAYIVLTVWLVQRGSAESKPIDDEATSEPDTDMDRAPQPVLRGGVRRQLYENSLGIAFAGLFLISFWLHALGGAREFSQEQMAHG